MSKHGTIIRTFVYRFMVIMVMIVILSSETCKLQTDDYSELCQTFKMELFVKTVNSFIRIFMFDKVLNTPLMGKVKALVFTQG